MSELALTPAVGRLLTEERRGAWLVIGAWFVATRALVFAATAGLDALGPHRWRFGPHQLDGFAPLASWDGLWYRDIAAHGYLVIPGRYSDTAFFPLYPMLLHVLEALGLGGRTAGIVLSNALFALALLALYELSCHWLPETDARRAAIAATLLPMGLVFSMAYPEALALLLIVVAALLARRERWLACAAVAAGAVLTRPEALFVMLPVAAAVRAAWPAAAAGQRGRALAAIASAPVAFGSFLAYLSWVTGDPRAWFHAERAWGRSFTLHGPFRAIDHFFLHPSRDPWLWRDLAFLLIYLGLTFVASRAGAPRSWIAAGALILLLPLGSGTVQSIGRFGLLAVPVYWGLAVLARRPWISRILVAAGLVLLAGSVFSLAATFP